MQLPDFDKAFDYENNFYLSCSSQRMSKLVAHYELFKMITDLPGAIVECGVFRGSSFLRWAMFRTLFGGNFSRKLIGFDTFGPFPEATFEQDKAMRDRFVTGVGSESITREELMTVLAHKGANEHVELVEGDVTKTIPEYVRKNPALRIAMIHVDIDLYEPSVTILEELYPRLVRGGVLILDDYGIFPGESKAVDDYFRKEGLTVKKFSHALSPCYIVKE